jgi:4-amino-4-deoxy-L-arabinose transferase-like glycosyltransferase
MELSVRAFVTKARSRLVQACFPLLNKSSYLDWLFGGLLLAIFLASRLLNLMALPIFVDEGLHIAWAQQMWAAKDFVHGTGDGKFLPIWLLALVVPWTSDPLAAARIISVISGLASGIATLYLAYTLWPQRGLVWTSAIIYLFLPLPLLCERMVLVDSLLTALATLILALSIKFIRHPTKAAGRILGLCLGLAYLTKLTGLFYLAIPILSFICLNGRQQSARILIRPYLVALVVAIPAVLEFPSQLVGAAVQRILNPTGRSISAGDWRLYGLGETWLDLITYVTWPVLLLAIMQLLHGLRSRRREATLLAILLLITPSFYILSAKDVWCSRYLLPIAPLLVILAAQALTNLASLLAQGSRLGHYKAWLALLCSAILLPSLTFDRQLITEPDQTPFTSVDRWQYVTGWPAGYGLDETIAWLRNQAAHGPLNVVTNIYSGPTQEGLRLYMGKGSPNIHLISINLQTGQVPLLQLIQSQPSPTVLLLNEPIDQVADAALALCPTVLMTFPKPEDQSRLVVRSCAANLE